MPRPRRQRRLSIPRRIVLGGKPWRVRVAARLPAPDDGTAARDARAVCDRTTRTIWLWRGLSAEERGLALCHELVHAMAGASDVDSQERLAERLEAPLHALLVSGQLVAVPTEEVR